MHIILHEAEVAYISSFIITMKTNNYCVDGLI